MAKVEIDEGSGFCFGVVNAISKAEEELAKGGTLYCLGDIVHNSREVERLKAMGLVTINHDEFNRLHDAKVLLRAHGEPPETYETARRNHIEIIDATCPVVLRLHKRIKQEYTQNTEEDKQIVIYGKNGHAEVLARRADGREGHRHRETGRNQVARPEPQHSPLLADNQVARRIPTHRRVYQRAHLARRNLRILRHHLPSGGQPHS